MTPSELADLFESKPSAAFRLTLSSGDTVDVLRPSQTLIGNLTVFINQYETPDARTASGTRIVSLPNIAMVEEIDPRRPRGRRPRRA